MKRALLRFAAVAAVGVAILAGVLYLATFVDARAPAVSAYRLSQHLADDEATALTTTSLEVIFSEPVEQATAERAFSIKPAVAGAFAWSGTTMTFTPAERLPLESEFEIRIGPGVRDLAGNTSQAAAQPFSFVTVGRPMVVATLPADGATDVPLDGSITVSFSTLMDTPSVEAALEIEPALSYELRWSGEELEIVPRRALSPNERYELRIGNGAADLTGTPLRDAFVMRFQTLVAGLDPMALVPADAVEGIAVTTPIAVIFDREIDPQSLEEEMFSIRPETPGSLDLIDTAGGASILRFEPSDALPPNTTVEVELAAGLLATDGAQLAMPLAWSFTTGAPQSTLGNQIVFLSERAGVSNLWAMNPDGTNQRQLSAELSPVVDYAVSPDGRRFVVGDGAQLVEQRADGSERRLLTEEGLVEFDPAFSPDGRRLAFGRASRETGGGLGLWERPVDGGDAERVALPRELGRPATPAPSPTTTGPEEPAPLLRAPRYSPDGSALAFVDTSGRVGIVELPGARLTTLPFWAVSAPVWLPASSGVLVSGLPAETIDAARTAPFEHPDGSGPLPALDAAALELPGDALTSLRIMIFPRSGAALASVPLGAGAARPAVDVDGRIAYVRLDDGAGGGALHLALSPEAAGEALETVPPLVAASVAFTPEEGTLLVARVADADSGRTAGIWLLREESGRAERRSADGTQPSWMR